MSQYTHEPARVATALIEGSDKLYPVRRIFCVGRNYAAHAREMGRDPDAEPPFFFTKFPETIVPSGSEIAYPPGTANYHYEMELVVALSGPLHNAGLNDIPGAVFGYCTGLDMTRRDLQLAARETGRPWDLGKNFDESAVLGKIVPMSGTLFTEGAITLNVGDDVKQSSDISSMIWSVAEILVELSKYYEVGEGDLIFTGTPEGVGAVNPGDHLVGKINGLPTVELKIRPAKAT